MHVHPLKTTNPRPATPRPPLFSSSSLGARCASRACRLVWPPRTILAAATYRPRGAGVAERCTAASSRQRKKWNPSSWAWASRLWEREGGGGRQHVQYKKGRLTRQQGTACSDATHARSDPPLPCPPTHLNAGMSCRNASLSGCWLKASSTRLQQGGQQWQAKGGRLAGRPAAVRRLLLLRSYARCAPLLPYPTLNPAAHPPPAHPPT